MDDAPLKLSAAEISAAFRDSTWAERYPPVLNFEQAAALLQVPIGTLREWRAKGQLASCCRRVGKRLFIHRDRLVEYVFNKK